MAENTGSKKLVIAIDGVVGAGKSATARGAARTLGYRHLDTGSMYRAFALAATRRDIQPNQSEALAQLLDELRLMLELERGVCRVYLDGEDVTEPIRDPAVSRRVGDYADVPLVRQALVERQRQLGAAGGVVADGRDVGAVIFPDADLKIYMTADLEERTRRRHAELVAKGEKVTPSEVRTDIEERDRQDQERDYGGEIDRREVVVLDTTGLTLEEQIERVVTLARERGG